jgi:integrase
MQNKLTKQVVHSAQPEAKEYYIWDTEVKGFGLRVFPAGKKSFVYQYRVRRRTRRVTLGNASSIHVQQAREGARAAAVTVQRGGDPLGEKQAKRDAITVEQLAERFVHHHVFFFVKQSTGREYQRALRNYILPALGKKAVDEVTRADVAKLHIGLAHKPTQANRTIEIVSKMFNLAEEWGLLEPGTNPRRGIRKYPETKRERFLSPAEIKRVSEVLCEMEAERIEMPAAIAAVRLLMMTGCRLNEIMTLKWEYVRLRSGFVRLPDSKTGAKDVQLGQPAIDILANIPRIENNPWVLTGKINGGRLTDLQPFWQRVRARAGLCDVRIHDLRHTFASVAAEAGMSLPMIGKLLGHSTPQSTARYAHLAAGTVRHAADSVAASIASRMVGTELGQG